MLAAGVVLLVGAFAWLGVWRGEYVFDDRGAILENAALWERALQLGPGHATATSTLQALRAKGLR